MDNNLKRTIMLDNYENSFNKGLTNDNSFDKVNANNETCFVKINIENNIIVDMHFDGKNGYKKRSSINATS